MNFKPLKHLNLKRYGYRYYDLDVFFKFKSQSDYQIKWGGELGIEVHNTNPVRGQKLKDLKTLRIPIIEVEVNKKLAYKTSVEYSTPETERKYIEFLKGRFSKYLWSKVLSDPKSIEYLEQENSHLLTLVGQLKENLRKSEISNRGIKSDLVACKSRAEENNIALVNKESKKSFLKSELKDSKSSGIFKFLWLKLTNR